MQKADLQKRQAVSEHTEQRVNFSTGAVLRAASTIDSVGYSGLR